MKKSILILALLTASLVSAQDLVWQSYTDPNGEQSYPIAFYSDGSIFSLLIYVILNIWIYLMVYLVLEN